jgi:hypothetical protein
MSRSLLLMFCLVIGLLVLACSKPAETNHNAASTNSAAPAGTPAATHSPATVAASGDKIGVPECDAFLTAYENCVSTKVPEQARAQFQAGVKTWRTEWKRLAENPQTKAGLVAACKRQQEAARTSLNKAYGCTL